MTGASAVWVLLECGDRPKDSQARAVLAKALSEAEKTLTLPEILPEDREQNMAPGGPELKIWFPVLSVSRKDPKEQFFVRMLSGSEQGIPTDAPVAFPIFGRGRLLGAFHGEMLDVAEVEEACAFLTGMCSCQVKEMCPGVDLLFTAGWHRPPGELFAMEDVPELVGTTRGALSVESGAKRQNGPPHGLADAPSAHETERTDAGRTILRNVLIVAGGGVVGVILVSLLLWMRSRRERG
jgi:hypothetical protein